MRTTMSAIVLALVLGATTPAHADPSIWVQCDGQPRPEGAATTAARIGAIIFIPIIGLAAAGETGTGTPAAVGQAGVDACTQALAEPGLANFWQRHMNILRARAIHYVEVGNHDAALADLVAMRAVAPEQVASPLLDRSLGVSSSLIEAALRARNGEMARAQELAVSAAEARPYSLPVQQIARGFFAAEPVVGADEQRLLQRELSYDATTALRRPLRLDQSDDAQAAADAWEAALAADDHMTTRGLDDLVGWKPADGPDGFTLVRAALAMARAGRLARAEELAARADAKLGPETNSGGSAAPGLEGVAGDAPAPDTSGSAATLAASREAQLRARMDQTLAESAAPFRPLLRAWLVAARGDDAGALSIMQSHFDRLPKVMASADLLLRLRQNPALQGQVPEFLVQSAVAGARPDPAQRYRESDLEDWIRALPQYERIDGQARYRASRMSGYSERELDSGATQITYAGGSYYSTSEMLMLRAAQLAQARGVDSFLVLDVNRNVLRVAFMDSAAPPPEYAARASRLIHAADVIASLGPLYIDLAAALEPERRDSRRRNY